MSSKNKDMSTDMSSKLTKKQEKRKKFYDIFFPYNRGHPDSIAFEKKLYKFIAKELSLQRKEIIGEIEKKREESRIYLEDGNFLLKPEEVVIYKYALDQAMKTIKRGE